MKNYRYHVINDFGQGSGEIITTAYTENGALKFARRYYRNNSHLLKNIIVVDTQLNKIILELTNKAK